MRLVRRWRSLGVDAPLYVGRPFGAMRTDVAVDLDHISFRSWLPGLGIGETFWMMLTLPRVIRQTRPDVLFCAGNTYAVIAVYLKLRMRKACPPIIAKISNDLHRSDKSHISRLCYRWWLRTKGRFLDRVVAMSEQMVPEIQRYFGQTDSEITVIPDPALSLRGPDAPLRGYAHPTPRCAGRNFVTVGRLAPQKNISLLLRAFARGSQESDRLTIIGDGPDRAKLERLAADLRVDGRVHFAGYVADAARLLSTFDIFVLSSDYEGVPAVILEARAAGLGIVATHCCTTIPALIDFGRGRLVPVGDEQKLAEAIRFAKISRSIAASPSWQTRFTIERAADAYIAVARHLRQDTRGA